MYLPGGQGEWCVHDLGGHLHILATDSLSPSSGPAMAGLVFFTSHHSDTMFLPPFLHLRALCLHCVCVCVRACACLCVFSHVQLFLTTWWTVAHQVPLSMGFPRQEYQSSLPFPPPRDLPDSGLVRTLVSCVSCIGWWILYHLCHLGSPWDYIRSHLENPG